MAPTSIIPHHQQPENTAFIKELQWKENRSQDEFLGHLLSDEAFPKDHIALKHSSSSSSSGGNRSQASTRLPTKPANNTSSTLADEPEIYTQLSINLWKRINAGYLIPRKPPAGVMKSVFTYDPSLIDCPSKEFHRKRDFFSNYSEAAARFKLVHGNKKPLSKPKRVVKGSEGANVAMNGSNPPHGDGEHLSTTNPDRANPINNEINHNAAPSIANGDANSTSQNPVPASNKATEPPS